MKHLGWMLVAATAAFALPAFGYSTPEPPATGTIHAEDPYAFENPETGDNTVTIAPGGTVSFDYPPANSSLPTVDFDADAPTSCVQLTGTNSGDVPPLPTTFTAAPWSGRCRF